MKTPYPVRIETSQYIFCHGHAPRGYGLWCFNIAGNGLVVRAAYSQAKAQAVRYARRLEVYAVTLLP